jgi:glutathione synthase/RimK-type ligase-like ATP-grasp enzyme
MLLILDETSNATLYSATSYTSYLENGDTKDLLLITNFASDEDKSKLTDFKEIPNPTSNGNLEVHAFKFNEKYKITSIYTKQEDLILRAAHLREELGIEGMKPEEAILFRDKVKMKEHLSQRGIKVPPFRRVFSPANVLHFAEKHGFPLVMKPTLGSASGGIRILKDRQDLEKYLETEFYDRIDDLGKVMDYSGDICVEAFVGGTMFHGT